MAMHQDAAQQAADVAAMLAETQEVIVVVALANPVKVLLVLTTVVVRLPSAQRKVAVVVHLVAAVVVSVAIKAITLATVAVMTSSPATFATTLAAMSLASVQTTKASAIAPEASLTHYAPA